MPHISGGFDRLKKMRPGTRIRWQALKPILIQEVQQKKTVIDIGGFDGAIGNLLSKALHSIDITIVDEDMNGLLKAKDSGLKVIKGSAIHFPIEDRSVDVVLCLDLIEHVNDAYPVIREISRVLKFNGKCILTTPMKQGVSFPFFTHQKNRNINFSWGHKTLGYSKEDLYRLFLTNNLKVEKNGRYFNILTRFIYRITILSKISYPLKSKLFKFVTILEPHLKIGGQEHIIVCSKSKKPVND